MKEQKDGNREIAREAVSRRAFFKYAGAFAAGVGVTCASSRVFAYSILLEDGTAAIPASKGYLLVDTKKCQGCLSCMLACSLVHEGVESLSLSRIQIMQNPFQAWPDDLTIGQCRQCAEPACVEACEVDALTADPAHGNVRRIDKKKCIGCMACIEACPFTPSRSIWNPGEKIAQKCDLCSGATHWHEKGGPDGKQACVEICPIRAIQFSRKLPEQKGDSGYKVNLRKLSWRVLGYPTE